MSGWIWHQQTSYMTKTALKWCLHPFLTAMLISVTFWLQGKIMIWTSPPQHQKIQWYLPQQVKHHLCAVVEVKDGQIHSQFPNYRMKLSCNWLKGTRPQKRKKEKKKQQRPILVDWKTNRPCHVSQINQVKLGRLEERARETEMWILCQFYSKLICVRNVFSTSWTFQTEISATKNISEYCHYLIVKLITLSTVEGFYSFLCINFEMFLHLP